MRSTPELATKTARFLAEPVASVSAAAPTRSLALGLTVLLPVTILGLVFTDSVAYMADLWLTDENYGHGMLVPLISLYLIWQQRRRLMEQSRSDRKSVV